MWTQPQKYRYSSLNLLPDCLKTHMCCARGPMLELEQNLWNERKIKDRIPISPTKQKHIPARSAWVQLLPWAPCGTETEVCVCCGRLFATPWAVARQVPLSPGFSRQEYWSGQPSPVSRGSSWPRGSRKPALFPQGSCHRPCREPAPGSHSLEATVANDYFSKGDRLAEKKSHVVTLTGTQQSTYTGQVLHRQQRRRRPCGLSPGNSPGQNAGVGSRSLLQGIFPTPRPPTLQADSLPAEPQGKPKE